MSFWLRVDGDQLKGLDFELLTLAYLGIQSNEKHYLLNRISAQATYTIIKSQSFNTSSPNLESLWQYLWQ